MFRCLSVDYATAIVAKGSPSGPRRLFRIYCSDAAGSATWPDGASNIVFGFNTYLVDVIFAATLATNQNNINCFESSPNDNRECGRATLHNNQHRDQYGSDNRTTFATGTNFDPGGIVIESSAELMRGD